MLVQADPTLSRHFSTITFDIRGEHSFACGVVDLAAEVIALLDYLGVEKTHVLGTSLGGFVAQELALERPDLVDRLTAGMHELRRSGTGAHILPGARKDARVGLLERRGCYAPGSGDGHFGDPPRE